MNLLKERNKKLLKMAYKNERKDIEQFCQNHTLAYSEDLEKSYKNYREKTLSFAINKVGNAVLAGGVGTFVYSYLTEQIEVLALSFVVLVYGSYITCMKGGLGASLTIHRDYKNAKKEMIQKVKQTNLVKIHYK